ncbi:hypothetical protein QFC22_000652 [Naganishia vaughanmartiniae]|uniref:Uncharacterized protein n=1 Tax=Naganishia vaughanmartiniae TaxID=1424756 RepID=A0ACC2XQF2_9TREE|nr:hypothetical protein QFC22_000652 [Naganishia vaughanmartiniae]
MSVGKIAQMIQAVNKSLTDATGYLPPYDQRRYAEIKTWQKTLAAAEGGKAGDANTNGNVRARFTFRKRAMVAPTTTTTTKPSTLNGGSRKVDPAAEEAEHSSQSSNTSSVQPTIADSSAMDRDTSTSTSTSQITIQDLSRKYITLDSLLPTAAPHSETDLEESTTAATTTHPGLSITIRNISLCVIDLRPRPPLPCSKPNEGMLSAQQQQQQQQQQRQQPRVTALYGDGIKDSIILAPGGLEEVAGSVMMHALEKVLVITACQQVCLGHLQQRGRFALFADWGPGNARQFRIHESEDAVLLLSIPSNPIIEHASHLVFGRYPRSLSLSLSPSADDHVPPPPTPTRAVQDFSWIKPSPSPNYRMMDDEESERVGALVERVVRSGWSGDDDDDGWEERLKGLLREVFTGPK